jgi:hypothetical protein
MLGAMVLAIVPTRGRAIVDFRPPGTEISGEVDCGSPFRTTMWSHDDGCEGPVLARGGAVVLCVLGALVVGGVGLTLWVVGNLPGRGYRIS